MIGLCIPHNYKTVHRFIELNRGKAFPHTTQDILFDTA